jgi:uncharacterized protein YggE
MLMTKLSFGLFALAMMAASSVHAQQMPPPPRIMALVGLGEVRARPDIALITLGVASRAATAREALTRNNAAMAEVIDYLKQAGIDQKDIQTSNFAVNPVYVYDQNNQQPPKITGYEASNQVTVTIRKLPDLGLVLDQAVSKGSNQIYGIAFSVAEPEPLQDQARRLAIADATRKAKLYAEAAGVTLGNITMISEQLALPPVPVYAKNQRMDAAAASVPVEAGEQLIQVQLNISWEIR